MRLTNLTDTPNTHSTFDNRSTIVVFFFYLTHTCSGTVFTLSPAVSNGWGGGGDVYFFINRLAYHCWDSSKATTPGYYHCDKSRSSIELTTLVTETCELYFTRSSDLQIRKGVFTWHRASRYFFPPYLTHPTRPLSRTGCIMQSQYWTKSVISTQKVCTCTE